MDMYVAKLIREPGTNRNVLLRVPVVALERAQIEPWAEVAMFVEPGRIVIETVQEGLEIMEMYAEEFVAEHAGLLQRLGDDECFPTE